jgi:RNA polymerase sigma-70 factor (ECF subfamily)
MLVQRPTYPEHIALTHDLDADDVRRVLRGDSAAFEGIVHRWQKPLLNLAWRSCRRRELAEDLAQEALLKIFRALASWRADSSFSTWIFAIALNHYRSRLRRSPLEILGLEAAREFPDPRADPGASRPDDPAEALRRAVVTLPPRYREAIVLHYFADQDVRSSAAILGIAEGTLKARLVRARALLARNPSVVLLAGPSAEQPQHG